MNVCSVQSLEGETHLSVWSVQAFSTGAQVTSVVPHCFVCPYKHSASNISKLAWTVEAVKPNSYSSPGRLFYWISEDKFIFRRNCRLIYLCPVLVNMQLAQATSLKNHTVGHRHVLNVYVRSVLSLEKGYGKQEAKERSSSSSTQLWPQVTKGEERGRRRIRI